MWIGGYLLYELPFQIFINLYIYSESMPIMVKSYKIVCAQWLEDTVVQVFNFEII